MNPFTIDYSVDIGSVANLASVLIATFGLYTGLRSIGRQISVSVFSEYSQRYHEIMRRFPVQIWTMPNVTFSSFSAEQASQLLNDYGDFFRLLAGERHLKALKFIDAKTWRLWTASTRQLMAQPVSKDAWKRLRASFNYDPGFQAFMDAHAK